MSSFTGVNRGVDILNRITLSEISKVYQNFKIYLNQTILQINDPSQRLNLLLNFRTELLSRVGLEISEEEVEEKEGIRGDDNWIKNLKIIHLAQSFELIGNQNSKERLFIVRFVEFISAHIDFHRREVIRFQEFNEFQSSGSKKITRSSHKSLKK